MTTHVSRMQHKTHSMLQAPLHPAKESIQPGGLTKFFLGCLSCCCCSSPKKKIGRVVLHEMPLGSTKAWRVFIYLVEGCEKHHLRKVGSFRITERLSIVKAEESKLYEAAENEGELKVAQEAFPTLLKDFLKNHSVPKVFCTTPHRFSFLSDKEQVGVMRTMVRNLADNNKRYLKRLLELWGKMVEEQENKMSSEALAKIFARGVFPQNAKLTSLANELNKTEHEVAFLQKVIDDRQTLLKDILQGV